MGGGGQPFHAFYTGEPLQFMERQGRGAELTVLQGLELIHSLRQEGSWMRIFSPSLHRLLLKAEIFPRELQAHGRLGAGFARGVSSRVRVTLRVNPPCMVGSCCHCRYPWHHWASRGGVKHPHSRFLAGSQAGMCEAAP